ncbi:MAG: DUF3280 domain-containing protein [Methylomonas sp.]
MSRLNKIIALTSLSLLAASNGYGAPRVAVLDFELNDITSLPNTQAELQRTASMAPLLNQALSQAGGYEMVVVDAAMQKFGNASFGYLFHFHELAAQLGQKLGADWIIVSQHSKPSFLFSYLMVHLIQVKTQKLAARYDIELKGNHEKVTQHSIKALADKIDKFIKKQP